MSTNEPGSEFRSTGSTPEQRAIRQAQSDIVDALIRLEQSTGRTVLGIDLKCVTRQQLGAPAPEVVSRWVMLELSPLPALNWSIT